MKAAKYLKWSLATIAVVMFTACGGGGGSDPAPAPAPGPGPAPEPTVITHNGTTYDTVTSPFTGKVWLDRNLGAAQVCIAYNDTACYGDYYQWGRNFDGHQDSLSGTTATLAVDVDNAGNEFITAGAAPFDWAPGPDSSGALRFANLSKTDGSNVCPAGYRVPTITELRNETVDASAAVNNSTDAFNNFLKLPVAGWRDPGGAMGLQGSVGWIWSSTTVGIDSQVLWFDNTGAGTVESVRVFGKPVRCIKN